ncbi:toxin-antitoxin system, toxin component [Streptomyces sp. NPDC049915]|uniref:toxin-antitoxin system, toxin component n=1 Tax=Streptomyces sp. NPDC049915 TaxID=3155510 RepID=UPI0034391CE0
MRQFSALLITTLRMPADGHGLIPALAEALTGLRGRPVGLRAAAFPPGTASGVWVDRTDHDLIVYEENTDVEHQHVIIGHEAWHMFQGHGARADDHGPAASRAQDTAGAHDLARFVADLSRAADTDLARASRVDAGLHFAARTHARQPNEELEAERFGFRFATDLRAALDEARRSAGMVDPARRIHASMAHRFPRASR